MEALIKTEELTKAYPVRNGFWEKPDAVTAVNKVSLALQKGRSLGLIGESGCGKSTFGRAVCGLEKIDGGTLWFGGKDVTNLSRDAFRPYRRNIQMVFQNNLAAFDPKYTIRQSIEEVLNNFEPLCEAERSARVERSFEQVGLEHRLLNRRPNELSGGERQRANIARAIILNPQVVVCDEPLASLDYSRRKSILNLLRDIGREHDVTYLFITHDLSTIRYICSQIAVMYLGEIVEVMDVENVEGEMLHPYTQLLFQAVLVADPEKRGTVCREALDGAEPLFEHLTGCAFRNRCRFRSEICSVCKPVLQEITPGHFVACHRISPSSRAAENRLINISGGKK